DGDTTLIRGYRGGLVSLNRTPDGSGYRLYAAAGAVRFPSQLKTYGLGYSGVPLSARQPVDVFSLGEGRVLAREEGQPKDEDEDEDLPQYDRNRARTPALPSVVSADGKVEKAVHLATQLNHPIFGVVPTVCKNAFWIGMQDEGLAWLKANGPRVADF